MKISESMRESLKAQYPNSNFDIQYKFYYDETNNVRKYHNEGGRLNYKGDGNFILGGVSFCKELCIDSLFEDLRIQKSSVEVKFKNIAKGDFFQILKSEKLNTVLNFMHKNNIYIHYHSTNLLYFAIVDIIDSAISGSEVYHSVEESHELKSVLYDILSMNLDKTIEFFHYFNYPNLARNNFKKFIYHIKKSINQAKIHKSSVVRINEILDKAVANGDLPFIVDETSNVFITSFFPFYFHPVSIFINSEHYFDNEELIKKAFNESKVEYSNYEFLDSKDSQLIQLSDIIVGMLGKFYQYINTTTEDRVNPDFKILSQNQQNTYLLFINTLNKALNKNPAFINNTMGIKEHLILNKILGIKGV
ncbi:MAG: hypothetical protein COA61_003005 [Zetaproteobacteria bacterium]|nr:hypothetical protein [Zetaproteobacteria bacterium]